MAYSPLMTAALTGASLRQLGHWRAPGEHGTVLSPEVSSQRPILYSFRDLIALRTCVYLRTEVSLQKIRKALNNLRRLGEREHLSSYKLVASGPSIALLHDDGQVDLVDSPGQGILVWMADVLGSFPKASGEVVPDLYAPREELEVQPLTQAGTPVIRHTRVPYDIVAGLVADGVAPEDVATYYPSVSAAAARDARDFDRYVSTYRADGGAADAA